MAPSVPRASRASGAAIAVVPSRGCEIGALRGNAGPRFFIAVTLSWASYLASLNFTSTRDIDHSDDLGFTVDIVGDTGKMPPCLPGGATQERAFVHPGCGFDP